MRFVLTVCLLALGLAPAAVADSLWSSGGSDLGSLYAAPANSFELGDIITILLVENMTARNEADLETEKDSNKRLNIQGLDHIGLPLGLDTIDHLFGQPLSANPSFSVGASSDFEGEGENNRSARISGTVSAQVTEVRANGTMRIEATQAVHINEEMNTIVLTGLIRPEDVRQDNTVLSSRVANAEIMYTGRGPLTNVNRRGLLTELWEFLWPF